MNVNLDHLRLLTTSSLNKLGLLINLHRNQEDIIKQYNELARYIQAINSVYNDKEKHFSDLSNTIAISFIDEDND